jgi:hypothetical protein
MQFAKVADPAGSTRFAKLGRCCLLVLKHTQPTHAHARLPLQLGPSGPAAGRGKNPDCCENTYTFLKNLVHGTLVVFRMAAARPPDRLCLLPYEFSETVVDPSRACTPPSGEDPHQVQLHARRPELGTTVRPRRQPVGRRRAQAARIGQVESKRSSSSRKDVSNETESTAGARGKRKAP